MPQKVIDIISIENVPLASKRAHNKQADKQAKRARPANETSGGNGIWSKILIVLAVITILGLGVGAGLSFQSKLTINVELAQDSKELTTDLTVDGTAASSDYVKKIVAGPVLEAESSLVKKFAATGQSAVGAKAKGVIRVFNKKNPPVSVPLVAQTRFLSSGEGKTFRAINKISLPPAIIENGKFTPSFQDVEVQAQTEGADYNIGPSKFSVPGLVGSPSYYDIWGESSAKMEGGTQEAVKTVTAQDIETSRQTLEQLLKQEVKASLFQQIGQNLLLDEKAILTFPPEVTCRQKEGDTAEQLDCQGKIKARGLAIAAGDLKDLAFRFLADKIASSTSFRMETVNLTLSPKNVNFDDVSMDLGIIIKAKVYESLNRNGFASAILGKSETQIRELAVREYPQIKKLDFQFWPFWVRQCPNSPEKVNVGFGFQD